MSDRTQSIIIRVSKEEKAMFEMMAVKSGLPISQYIRNLVVTLYYKERNNDNIKKGE